MGSTLAAAHARIATDIAGINGAAGGYTHDLTGTGVVKVGHTVKDPANLGVYIDAPEVETSDDAPLAKVRRTVTIPIIGFTGATQLTDANRLYAAENLFDDIATALEADRSLNSNVISLEMGLATFLQADDYGETVGDLVTSVIFWYEPTTGA